MKKEMVVYMVAGSFDYEGDWVENSGKVFLNYEDGVKYGESLVNGSSEEYMKYGVKYDHYVIKKVKVE